MTASQVGVEGEVKGFSNVFTYGTLMIPEILATLTGKSFPFGDARLEGYIRLRVKGRPYPGIMAKPGAYTEGKLYRGVDEQSIAVLDRFEGMLYERQTRLVRIADRLDHYAEVYVVKKEHEQTLSVQPWELQWFQDEWLEAYLRSCEEFRSRLKGM